MGASLDDILSTQKNGVIAINNLSLYLKTISSDLDSIVINTGSSLPKFTSPTILASTTTQIVVGSGRIYGVSIPVHGGAAQISIYDSATVGGISASNCIYKSLPSNASTFAPYELVTMTYSLGIVIACEAGMNACVTYTPN